MTVTPGRIRRPRPKVPCRVPVTVCAEAVLDVTKQVK